MIPHIHSQGVRDILAIDVAPNMLAELESTFPVASTVGNDPAVRTWLGAFEDLPLHQGRADVIFMNAVFGNLQDQHTALLHSCLLLNPGGKVVISHPLGATHTLCKQNCVLVLQPNRKAEGETLKTTFQYQSRKVQIFTPSLCCVISAVCS